MRNIVVKISWILVLSIYSCNDNDEFVEYEITAPKIILVAGQSNTCAGIGMDPSKDFGIEGIYQLGRFGNQNFRVIPAEEPLQHYTKSEEKIGFALTFAKHLFDHFQKEEDIIIVPCGYGGTGFIDQRWNKSNDLYKDAVNRVNFLTNKYPLAEVVAILWHQGEKDANEGNTHYMEDLDQFITNIRLDLGNENLPFILGGMVPYWTNKSASRLVYQEIIKNSTLRHVNLRYADPNLPFVIDKMDNSIDEIHFNAEGQRILGERYFEQFLSIIESSKGN